ncbi:MAG: Fic family protein [Candidatus Woesearchaeota archaeon]
MVFIYKKTIGNEEYYYLRASSTKNGKQIVKDIAYLGNDFSKIKEKLDELPAKYQKEIRKTYKTIHKFLEVNHYLEKIKEQKLKQDEFLSKDFLNSIESCKLHWETKFQKLDVNSREEILNDFLIDFCYNTTSIEGNTITLKETEKLFVEHKTPKDRSLREIYDLQNTKKVFFDIFEKKLKINHKLIEKIHDDLLENVDVRKGYRTTDIRVTKSRFSSSPAQYVKTDMDLLLKWFDENKKLHPLILASLFHHKFEKIHPFADGNGRTGRMLANLILLKNNYPPLIIRKKNRTKYLNALSKADEEDINSVENYSDLIKFMVKEYVDCYWNVFL